MAENKITMAHENFNLNKTFLDAKPVVAIVGLTKEEVDELQLLRFLQTSNERYLSTWEFDRIAELSRKEFEDAGSPHCI